MWKCCMAEYVECFVEWKNSYASSLLFLRAVFHLLFQLLVWWSPSYPVDGNEPHHIIDWCNTVKIVPSAFPHRKMASSFLLGPKILIAFLQSLFRCSWWKSSGIFRPWTPCVLANAEIWKLQGSNWYALCAYKLVEGISSIPRHAFHLLPWWHLGILGKNSST